jgi:hypothetical protein
MDGAQIAADCMWKLLLKIDDVCGLARSCYMSGSEFRSICLMQGYITLLITKIGRDIRSPRLGRLIPFEVD